MGEEAVGRRRALYNEGKSDHEIARVEGLHPSAIYQWRKHNGLRPNVRRNGKPLNQTQNADRMGLYRQGLSDSVIADMVGVTSYAICAWRKVRNLPANSRRVVP